MSATKEDDPWQIDSAEDFYGTAVLRLATYLQRPAESDGWTARLLFAAVELLPNETEPIAAVSDTEPLSGLGSSSDRIFYDTFNLTVDQALRWYDACRSGTLYVPKPDDGIDLNDHGTAFDLHKLLEEPTWPNLSLATEESRLPFVPKCWNSPHNHHLLADEEWRAPWLSDERDKAIQFLNETLAFDIEEWSELLGSAHLIAPNPYLRAVRYSLDDESNQVPLHVEGRDDVDIPELTLTTWGKRISGITNYTSRSLSPGVEERIDVPADLVGFGVRISSEHGLLHESGPAPFMRSFQINMALATPRKIRVEGRRRTEEFDAPVYRDEQLQIGEAAKPGGAELLRLGQRRRKLQKAGKDEQFWFDDEPERARKVVRRLIAEARSQVLIVDPYFGGDDLMSFCTARGRTGVEVRVLSSWMFLRRTIHSDEEDDILETKSIGDHEEHLGEVEKEAADEQRPTEQTFLLSALESLNQQGFDFIDVRMLPGRERAPIHDRYLIIDDEAWLLGSSFNKFGCRGTTLLKLHESESIIRLMTSYWENESHELTQGAFNG